MGIFTNTQEKVANSVYEKCKQYIKPKDGLTHVLLIESFSKIVNQTFQCEDKYTTQLNVVIEGLQQDGYEIIDIKINTLMNQGLTGQNEGFYSLIIYK